MTDAHELPMFPLGSVLLPGMALPLQVFEPRYLAMMERVLGSSPPRFGVVLIERGSEVGGGDVRTDVGCAAEVRSHESIPDGRLLVLAVGTHRIRVERWLPDDPHPLALVRDWPDEDDGDPGADGPGPADLDRLTGEVADLVDLATELTGRGPGPIPPLDDDPGTRLHQLATLAPLGALDRQSVLRAPGVAERFRVLSTLVEDQRILLEARRGFGSG